MAASGIAEHAEARRRQQVINKRAYNYREMMDRMKDNPDMYDPPAEPPRASYEQECESYSMRKMGSPPGMNYYQAPIVDKMRREQVYKDQLRDYSAKLPKRLSSTDYTQQW